MFTLLALVASILGLVTASPASAEPTLSVDPSTDLIDRQQVSLTATGFSPQVTFGAAQCDLETAQDNQDITGCDLSTSVLTSTDAAGEVSTTMRVRRYIEVAGEIVDCAEPDRCIIGAATLDSDLATPLENAFVPISFDPDAPALPPLTVAITVDEVSADGVTGTVQCNRDADAFVDVSLQQAKAGAQINRYGYGDAACGTDPTPFEVDFHYGEGRLTGGSATYQAYSSAYDGVEGASDFVEGTVHVTGNSGLPDMPGGSFPGQTIEIVGVEGGSTRGQPELRVTVVCDEPTMVYTDGSVSQLAGLSSVYGYGNNSGVACDGTTEVTLPLMTGSGVIAGGPASANVSVYASGDEFFDYASWAGPVTLSGNSRSESPELEPNPDSRITIVGATASTVTGTIVCEEPAMVDISVSLHQRRGRTSTDAYGYTFLPCDGETTFEAELFGPTGLKSGPADVAVWASAYRIEPGPDYPEYIYLWDDYQAGSVRVRR
ncbi:MAG: neocarzinostatin apoprotein domain-containing protein [Acidimicrobiia bacterium]|nr:neocarzinostatin apoprotein domain-containing protein [Acidimicrobiia bacterium]